MISLRAISHVFWHHIFSTSPSNLLQSVIPCSLCRRETFTSRTTDSNKFRFGSAERLPPPYRDHQDVSFKKKKRYEIDCLWKNHAGASFNFKAIASARFSHSSAIQQWHTCCHKKRFHQPKICKQEISFFGFFGSLGCPRNVSHHKNLFWPPKILGFHKIFGFLAVSNQHTWGVHAILMHLNPLT